MSYIDLPAPCPGFLCFKYAFRPADVDPLVSYAPNTSASR